jgi:hypothetical protein
MIVRVTLAVASKGVYTLERGAASHAQTTWELLSIWFCLVASLKSFLHLQDIPLSAIIESI